MSTMKTKGDLVRFGIAFALRKLRFKRAPLGLSEEQRTQLADDAVKEMQSCGGWQSLDEPLDKDTNVPPLRNESTALLDVPVRRSTTCATTSS